MPRFVPPPLSPTNTSGDKNCGQGCSLDMRGGTAGARAGLAEERGEGPGLGQSFQRHSAGGSRRRNGDGGPASWRRYVRTSRRRARVMATYSRRLGPGQWGRQGGGNPAGKSSVNTTNEKNGRIKQKQMKTTDLNTTNEK